MIKLPLTADDIECFFVIGELAVQAEYKGVPIPVIFREDSNTTEMGTVGIENQGPYAYVMYEDGKDMIDGDEITIEEIEYFIHTPQPNSQSYIMILLEKKNGIR